MLYAILLLWAAPGAEPVSDRWEAYHAARELNQLEIAAEIAEELVETSLAAHGDTSTQFGMALGELGATQLLIGEHVAALPNLTMAEEVLRDAEPVFSEKLVTTLAYLGAELQVRGRQEEAMDALTRAQHITHRLYGNHNPEQIPLVYAKSASEQFLGHLWQAEELERFAYLLHVENYGIRSEVTIAASARLGTWLRSIGDYSGSIAHFHSALEDVQGDGPDRPEAVPLLRGMAHAYRGGFRGKHARDLHERVIAVMARHADRFSVDDTVVEHLRYGDWLMQRHYESEAIAQYQAAWSLADAAGPDAAHWIEQLSQPSIVRYEGMAPTDIEGKGAFVDFAFELRTNGHPYRVDITDHAVSTRDRSRAKKTFRKTVRFRPAIVDGVAQSIENASVRLYVVSEGTHLEPAPVSAPALLTRQAETRGLDPYALQKTLLTLQSRDDQ